MLLRMSVLMTAAFLVASADGAILSLENAADGSASIDLAPGESGELNIVLEIHAIDSGLGGVQLFLDDDDAGPGDSLEITAVTEPLDDVFEYLEVDLPTLVDDYFLHMSNGVVLEAETYLLVSLTVTNTGDQTAGTVELVLSGNHNFPHLFTPGLVLYAWDFGLAGIIPNFADPGVGGQDNPFEINLVPPSEECDGDANGDGVVDPLDSGFVLSRFGCEVDAGDPDCDTADQNDDGTVDPLDVGYVLARFGDCQAE